MHKSAAIHLLHELTSPRWSEVGEAKILSLDEEGYVEADVFLGTPPRQKVSNNVHQCSTRLHPCINRDAELMYYEAVLKNNCRSKLHSYHLFGWSGGWLNGFSDAQRSLNKFFLLQMSQRLSHFAAAI